MDHITLTFAELAFLVEHHGADPGESLRTLGLRDLAELEGVRAAGLASLSVRELVAFDEDGSAVGAPELAAAALALARPLERVSLGEVAGDGSIAPVAQLIRSEIGAVAVTPAGALSFRFRGLADEADLAEVATALIIDQIRDGSVFAVDAAATGADRALLVRGLGGGRVSVLIGDDVARDVDSTGLRDLIVAA